MELNTKEKNNIQQIINTYDNNLEIFKRKYLNIEVEKEFKELFKGTVVLLLENIVLLYNLRQKKPELKFSKSAEKISNINSLMDCLKNDTKLLGCDVNEVIMRGYVSYFYTKYRDLMMDWDISKIKNIEESDVKDVVNNTVTSQEVMEMAKGYFNIVPEIVMMVNLVKEKEILKLLYLLNNINVIIDVYLYKKNLLKL